MFFWIAGFLFGAFLLIATAGLAWILLPGWLSRRFGNIPENDPYRQGLTQIFGFPLAIVGGIGLVITTVQALDAFRSAQTALFRDQYRHGFEALSSEEMATRIGGLYVLQDLLDSSDDCSDEEVARCRPLTILRAIAAFAVDRSRTGKGEGSQSIIRADALTALQISTGRTILKTASLDLRDGYFVGSRLPHANLSHSDLYRSDLRGSDLYMASLYQSSLRSTDLRGVSAPRAIFSNSGLSGANFAPGINYTTAELQSSLSVASRLAGAEFYSATGSDPNFFGACLPGAVFNNVRFQLPNFSEADLYQAKFQHAVLSEPKFTGDNLSGSDFGPDPKGSDNVTEIRGGSFSESNLSSSKFNSARLTNVSFARANLRNADFSNAVLSNVDFRGADLTDAIFKFATLDSPIFDDATLKRTDFTNAKLSSGELTALRLCQVRLPDGVLWEGDCSGPAPNLPRPRAELVQPCKAPGEQALPK